MSGVLLVLLGDGRRIGKRHTSGKNLPVGFESATQVEVCRKTANQVIG